MSRLDRIFTIAVTVAFLGACEANLGHFDEDTLTDGEDTADIAADVNLDGVDTAADTASDTPYDTGGDSPADTVLDTATDDVAVDDALVDDVLVDDVLIDDVFVDDVLVDDVTIDDVIVDDPAIDDVHVDDLAVDDLPVEWFENCGNGYDDDGDGRIDCMDSDCLTYSGCTGTCYPAASITCGGTISSSNYASGSTDRITTNSCSTWTSWTGPEIAYQFELSTRRNVTINLTGLTADLDLFLYSGGTGTCSSTSCLVHSYATGSASEQIVRTMDPGVYYIVIDGYSDAISTFNLGVTCTTPEICGNFMDDDGDGFVDCADSDCTGAPGCATICTITSSLSCGSVVNGSTATAGATDVISTYGCSSWTEDGPERIYSFLSSTTRSVTVTIDTLSTTYLDLFVLGNPSSTCNPADCISSSATDDASDIVTFSATGGRTYYFSVDGYAGYSGTYRISVVCS